MGHRFRRAFSEPGRMQPFAPARTAHAHGGFSRLHSAPRPAQAQRAARGRAQRHGRFLPGVRLPLQQPVDSGTPAGAGPQRKGPGNQNHGPFHGHSGSGRRSRRGGQSPAKRPARSGHLDIFHSEQKRLAGQHLRGPAGRGRIRNLRRQLRQPHHKHPPGRPQKPAPPLPAVHRTETSGRIH